MKQITDLPPELARQIIGYLDIWDKITLRAVNSRLCQLLTPEVFRTLTVNNEFNSFAVGLQVQYAQFLALKYGEHVTHLDFCPSESGSEEAPSTAKRLPAIAEELLQGQHMPNLRSVSLHLYRDLRTTPEPEEDPAAFLAREPEQLARMREHRDPVRARIEEAWQHISSSTRIKELKLRCFVPTWTSTFGTAKFHQFLGCVLVLRMN
jgi:hypothetical protein